MTVGRIGYCPGVFDMFHIGHLRIIERARAHCDFLVVGVVNDTVTEEVKGQKPIIGLEERMEIVRALRIVDDVVEDDEIDKFRMWPRVGYHILFKGDDWQGTDRGDKLEADLATVGARVHFFPYTQSTSSTELRAIITT